jgi:nucleoside-diphosphate-sugar epimerase
MVYVTDVAEAFLLACVEPAAAGQELIIAGPEAVPLRVMLQTLAQLVNRRRCGPTLPLKPMLKLAAVTEDVCHHFGLRPPIYRRRMDFYLNDAAFDCRRAQAVLGWKPKVDLREGLANTLRTYDTEQVTDVWNSWAGVSVQAMVAAEALETGSRLVS